MAEVERSGDVDEIRLVGSPGVVDPTLVVDTRDFVRPIWQDGRVVLVLQSAAGGMLMPFGTADPRRCCEDHRPRRT